ncbi:hypothetical protein TNCV_2698631 [Trichonephila clavipes]|nr:hypothetical protein TNCV_2698631 [Trichonephila clavipes]
MGQSQGIVATQMDLVVRLLAACTSLDNVLLSDVRTTNEKSSRSVFWCYFRYTHLESSRHAYSSNLGMDKVLRGATLDFLHKKLTTAVTVVFNNRYISNSTKSVLRRITKSIENYAF